MSERYSHLANPNNARGFFVQLARSGQTIRVPPGSSILQALLRAGIQVPYNCGDGKCGACEIRVLAGVPDHHGAALTGSHPLGERSVLTCCSSAVSETLVLDL